jgi:Ca2+/Na+ antiporter
VSIPTAVQFLILAEENSTAYEIGYVFGRVFFIVLIVAGVVALVRWANRRWPGDRG